MKKFLASPVGGIVACFAMVLWWTPCLLTGMALTGLLWKFGQIPKDILILDLYGVTAAIILIHAALSTWSIWASGKTWGENFLQTSREMVWDISVFGITVNTARWFWK
jgi:hypothetical protein